MHAGNLHNIFPCKTVQMTQCFEQIPEYPSKVSKTFASNMFRVFLLNSQNNKLTPT